LSTAGQRLVEVAARKQGGTLQFTADVAGHAEHGALILYEVVEQ